MFDSRNWVMGEGELGKPCRSCLKVDSDVDLSRIKDFLQSGWHAARRKRLLSILYILFYNSNKCKIDKGRRKERKEIKAFLFGAIDYSPSRFSDDSFKCSLCDALGRKMFSTVHEVDNKKHCSPSIHVVYVKHKETSAI